MESLDLIYIKPFRIRPGSPFDFRIENASCSLARAESERTSPKPHHKETPDKSTAAWDLGVDPVRILATTAEPVAVDGHHRLSEAARLELDAIPALVYPGTTSRDTVVSLSLKGKAASLSGAEKIIALYKTTVFAKDEDPNTDIPLVTHPSLTPPDWILPLHSDLLGRNVSKPYVCRLFDVLAFSANELWSIHDLTLTVEQAASLLDLTPEERGVVFHLCDEVRFTTAEFWKLVKLLLFARGRSGFDLDAWIKRKRPIKPGDAAGSQIVGLLAREICPELYAAMEKVNRAIRQMRLPNRLRIVPPENLEGESFSCYFKFSTSEEFREYVERLNQTIDDGSVEQILRLLDIGDLERETDRDGSY